MMVEIILLTCFGFIFLTMGHIYKDKFLNWIAVILFIGALLYTIEDYLIYKYLEILMEYREEVRGS